jgi:hypothetical protein
MKIEEKSKNQKMMILKARDTVRNKKKKMFAKHERGRT